MLYSHAISYKNRAYPKILQENAPFRPIRKVNKKILRPAQQTMKIVHYCQHVLGMGHFFRSLEIDKALCEHDVTLVTGGTPVEISLPPHVHHEMLPPLMMDANFSQFFCGENSDHSPEITIEQIKQKRAAKLHTLLEKIRPDIFLVELFPFGRKQFSFELLPVLKHGARGDFGPMRSLCSLRDILVEKSNQFAFEKRVLSLLNPLFHGVLVHTDPNVITLEETFSRVQDITIPILNTGYISPQPSLELRQASCEHAQKNKTQIRQNIWRQVGTKSPPPSEVPLIIASAGSGSVGYSLLSKTIAASANLQKSIEHTLVAFTGPFMTQDEKDAIRQEAVAHPHIFVTEFAENFVTILAAADLSISMGGYNTTMNLLAAGTFGLVLPFDQNREQRMRSERLAKLGALEVLSQEDLSPKSFAQKIMKSLSTPSTPHAIDIHGAPQSAALIEKHFGPKKHNITKT